MPDPAKIEAAVRRAAVLVRAQKGRTGVSVCLEDAEDVVVGGDMHGNVENFSAVYKMADLAKHPQRHLVLQELVHGPFEYVGGGDKSHQLVELYSALVNQFPGRVHYLMGNHEMAELTGHDIVKMDESCLSRFAAGVVSRYGERASKMQTAYMELFSALPVAIRCPNRLLLTHSLPRPRALDGFDPATLCEPKPPRSLYEPKGAYYDLVWGRETSPAHVERYLTLMDSDKLVSGHIICEQGFFFTGPRHLIIDGSRAPSAVAVLPAQSEIDDATFRDCVRGM